jgi:hypothetical protein
MKSPYCEHGVAVSVDPDKYGDGVTLWQHGDNPEHARLVTLEERARWHEQGYTSGVHEIFAWIATIHSRAALGEAQ